MVFKVSGTANPLTIMLVSLISGTVEVMMICYDNMIYVMPLFLKLDTGALDD